MPTVNDWDIDYVNKVFIHVDGRLAYDTNTGTAPALGDFVRGTNSGAIGRIIAGSDLGGTSATGTIETMMCAIRSVASSPDGPASPVTKGAIVG